MPGEEVRATGAKSPPRAKIELLVRSESGDDFRVTKVESSLAYRQARPQRIPESQYEVAALRSNVRQTTTYVVKNLSLIHI